MSGETQVRNGRAKVGIFFLQYILPPLLALIGGGAGVLIGLGETKESVKTNHDNISELKEVAKSLTNNQVLVLNAIAGQKEINQAQQKTNERLEKILSDNQAWHERHVETYHMQPRTNGASRKGP